MARRNRYSRPAPGTIVRQPTPVSKGSGVAVQYGADGKPQSFVKPGFGRGVSLSAGWGIEYGADGKPVRFVPPAKRGSGGGGGQPAAGQSDVAPVPGELTPDAAYFTGQAANLFKLNEGLRASDEEGVANEQSRTMALAQLRRQQPVDERATTASSNKRGLLYSTTYGNDLGSVREQYVGKEAGVQSQYASNERARLAARAAIQAGYGVDDAAAMASAADRQIARDTTAADGNYLVKNPGSAAAAQPKPKPAPAPRPAAPRRPRTPRPVVVSSRRQPTTTPRPRRPRPNPNIFVG